MGQDVLQGGSVLALQAFQKGKAGFQEGKALRVPLQAFQVVPKLPGHGLGPVEGGLQVLGQGLQGPIQPPPGPKLPQGGLQGRQGFLLQEP